MLKYVGAIYLLWLAWKLARAAPMSAEQAARAKPMGFFGAAAFQWVNPKAWLVCGNTSSNGRQNSQPRRPAQAASSNSGKSSQ